jgi:hypothetical protein
LWPKRATCFRSPRYGRDGVFFLFGADDVDPGAAPRDTSIRRALLEEMDAGRPLLSGGMFILREDLKHFGVRYYRRHWSLGEVAGDGIL